MYIANVCGLRSRGAVYWSATGIISITGGDQRNWEILLDITISAWNRKIVNIYITRLDMSCIPKTIELDEYCLMVFYITMDTDCNKIYARILHIFLCICN